MLSLFSFLFFSSSLTIIFSFLGVSLVVGLDTDIIDKPHLSGQIPNIDTILNALLATASSTYQLV
jgi:hypothetical protein